MSRSIEEEILAALWLLDAMFALWVGWTVPAIMLFTMAGICLISSIGASVREYKKYKERLNNKQE